MKDRDYSLLLLLSVGAVAWFMALVMLASCGDDIAFPPDARSIDAGCVPAMIANPPCNAQLVCPVRPYPEGCTDQPDGTVCCERT